MELAFGKLRIRPRDFWRYSLREWLHTVEGYNKSLGGDQDAPFLMDDLEELERQFG